MSELEQLKEKLAASRAANARLLGFLETLRSPNSIERVIIQQMGFEHFAKGIATELLEENPDGAKLLAAIRSAIVHLEERLRIFPTKSGLESLKTLKAALGDL